MEESGWRGRCREELGDYLLPVRGGGREAAHCGQTMNSIDGFLIVGRRAGLDKGRVNSCPALPRTEEFPGAPGIQTRMSRSP